MLQPSDESIGAVTSWLIPMGVYRLYPGDFVNDRFTFQEYGLTNASTTAKACTIYTLYSSQIDILFTRTYLVPLPRSRITSHSKRQRHFLFASARPPSGFTVKNKWARVLSLLGKRTGKASIGTNLYSSLAERPLWGNSVSIRSFCCNMT